MTNDNYVNSAKKQFLYYKMLGEKAIERLSTEQLFMNCGDNNNSIAVIVRHLSGNMLSRWTDFLTTDGEKLTRNRDNEFENDVVNREDLLIIWHKGWNCFFATLDLILSEHLNEIVYIRNEGHTVIEAINRQLAHYPYHIGQIIFIAKMLNTSEWVSLSIPKNKSQSYNNEKFNKDKKPRNFFDDDFKIIS